MSNKLPKYSRCYCGKGPYDLPTAPHAPSSNTESESATISDVNITRMQRHIGSRAAAVAEAKVGMMKRPSSFASRSGDDGSAVAPVGREEIEVGRVIGSGGYAVIREVSGFSDKLSSEDESSYSDAQREARLHLQRASDKPDADGSKAPKFAMKMLRKDVFYKPEKVLIAASDLAIETEMMLAMDHPHILKLRGYSSDGFQGFENGSDGYFIILDRLTENLKARLGTWREKCSSQSNKPKRFSLRRVTSRRKTGAEEKGIFLAERVEVARCIASALSYLHENKILHRDVKSANIGFGPTSASGDVKLFDFGMSCVLSSPLCSDPENPTYDLGKAGTEAFMAPEVYESKPYNEKADVYSFGMVLWEILSMCSAGPTLKTWGTLHVCSCWPRSLQKLVRRTLSEDMRARPSMKEIELILEGEVKRLNDTLKSKMGRGVPAPDDASGHTVPSQDSHATESSNKAFVGDAAVHVSAIPEEYGCELPVDSL